MFPESLPRDLESLLVVCGADEAGRGPLAGPVVCAAVLVSPEELRNLPDIHGITDSKQLPTELEREMVFEEVLRHFPNIRVTVVPSSRIDEINILEASLEGLVNTVSQMDSKPARILIDGPIIPTRWREKGEEIVMQPEDEANMKPGDAKESIHAEKAGLGGRGDEGQGKSVKMRKQRTLKMVRLEGCIDAIPVIKGDSKEFLIAAASIVAKVTRDRIMAQLGEIRPEYGFDKHKGYGTKSHMDSVQQCGPCREHRASFAPIGEILMQDGKKRDSDAAKDVPAAKRRKKKMEVAD